MTTVVEYVFFADSRVSCTRCGRPLQGGAYIPAALLEGVGDDDEAGVIAAAQRTAWDLECARQVGADVAVWTEPPTRDEDED